MKIWILVTLSTISLAGLAEETQEVLPQLTEEIETLSESLSCSAELEAILERQREEILPLARKIQANYDKHDVNQTIKEEAYFFFTRRPYPILVGNNSEGLTDYAKADLVQAGYGNAFDMNATQPYVTEMFEKLFEGEEVRDNVEVYYLAATSDEDINLSFLPEESEQFFAFNSARIIRNNGRELSSEDLLLTLEKIRKSDSDDIVQINIFMKEDGSNVYAIMINNDGTPFYKYDTQEACAVINKIPTPEVGVSDSEIDATEVIETFDSRELPEGSSVQE